MNKIAAGLAGLLGIFAASSASAGSFDALGKSMYKLYDGADSICSSVAVSPTQLVTAKHCMGSTELNITVEKLDKEFKVISSKTLYLKEIRTLSKFDQVMLELKDPDETLPTWVTIAKPEEVKLELGSPIVALGFPKVMELTLTHGEFSSMTSLKKFDDSMTEPFYKVTIPITGGNSGGGLFQEIDGTYKLIGLATAGFRDVSFLNYFSTVEGLRDLTASLIKFPEDKVKDEKAGKDVTKTIDDGKRINPSDLR